MVNKKTRRHSGRISPRDLSRLPFKVKEELDLTDEFCPTYDEWMNYRDGFRNAIEKNKIKFLRKRKKYIPKSFFRC